MVRRKAIKSALVVFNPKEVVKIKEIEKEKEKKEKKEEVLMGIIISIIINRLSVAIVIIRVIKRAFIFIKINIFISTTHRLINFFLSSL